MKNTILAILLLTPNIILAGFPPTTIKGQSTSANAPTTFNFQTPNFQSTRINSTTVLIETGNDNWAKNPGFEGSTTSEGWSVVSSTIFGDSTTFFKSGKKALSVTAQAGSYPTEDVLFKSDLYAPGSDNRGSTVQASIFIGSENPFTSGYTLYLARYNSSDVEEERTSIPLTYSSAGFVQYTLNIMGGDSTKKYGVFVTRIGISSGHLLAMDNFRIGPQYVESGKLDDTFTTAVSSSGTLSRQSPYNWLTGCVYTSSTFYRCTYASGIFANSTPTCDITVTSSGTSVQAPFKSEQSTYVDVYFRRVSDSSAIQLDFTLTCHRTGGDTTVSVITGPNYNYRPTLFTPTMQGVVVNSSECKQSRIDAFLFLDCKITPTSTSAVEARLNLPGGLKGVALTEGIKQAGNPFAKSASGCALAPLIESGSTYLTFGCQDGSTSGLTKVTGSTITGATASFSFQARIEIDGWGVTSGRPAVPGSYFSDSDVIQRTDSAIFGGASNTAVCSSAGACNKYGAYTGWFTATRTGTAGVYNIAFTKPYVDTNYVCQTSYEQWSSTSTQVPQCLKSSKTTSGFTLTCTSSAGATDVAVALSCSGQK